MQEELIGKEVIKGDKGQILSSFYMQNYRNLETENRRRWREVSLLGSYVIFY